MKVHDLPTLIHKVNWALKVSQGGFKKGMKYEPDQDDTEFLSGLKEKLHKRAVISRADSDRLELLFMINSPSHSDGNLKVTKWNNKE